MPDAPICLTKKKSSPNKEFKTCYYQCTLAFLSPKGLDQHKQEMLRRTLESKVKRSKMFNGIALMAVHTTIYVCMCVCVCVRGLVVRCCPPVWNWPKVSVLLAQFVLSKLSDRKKTTMMKKKKTIIAEAPVNVKVRRTENTNILRM